MKLTRTQQKVVTRFEEIGGIGWTGTRIVNGKFDLATWARNVKSAFGRSEYERATRVRKRLGVNSNGVWCSGATMLRLQEAGIIEPVHQIPGVWRLTTNYKEKIEAT